MMRREPMSTYYITTPIYYVNAEPHLGHAYTTVVADVATRHARQRGEDAFFLTGTDEHGAKVAQAAAAAGIEPKAWADPIAERFRELARRLDADYGFFIRTTDPEHEAFVQRFVDDPARARAPLRGLVLRLLLHRLRAVLPRGGAGRREALPAARHGAGVDRGEEPLLPPLGVPAAAARPLRRAPRLRAAARPHERDARLRRVGSRGSLDHAPGRDLGRSRALGHVAVDLRLGRRAAQLRVRADLRAAGRGSDRRALAAALAGARQGHPPLPRDHLARAPAGGRLRAAAPAVHPRLPART